MYVEVWFFLSSEKKITYKWIFKSYSAIFVTYSVWSWGSADKSYGLALAFGDWCWLIDSNTNRLLSTFITKMYKYYMYVSHPCKNTVRNKNVPKIYMYLHQIYTFQFYAKKDFEISSILRKSQKCKIAQQNF